MNCRKPVGRRAASSRSVLLFDLAVNEVFQTNSVSPQYDEFVLTDEEFETLGPAIVDIVAHGEGLNVSSNFNYEIKLQVRGEYGNWADASPNLLGPLTGTGAYTVGNPFTDRPDFGRRIRIIVRCYVTAGQSGTQRASLTLLAAVRLYCGC